MIASRFLRCFPFWRGLVALAAVLAGAAAQAAGPAKPKLNVLFLVADDLNCDLGCYGAPGLKTPNIDRLAARGVRFDRAYCQSSLCSPSRSSFLTGRRPNATGVHINPGEKNPYAHHFRSVIPTTVTLPELFKDHGWMSVRVGKLYHYGVPEEIGSGGLDDYPSWDLAINPRGWDRDNQDLIHTLVPGRYGNTLSWLSDDEGDDTAHTDGIGADEAIRQLERFHRNAKPFFLAVGFYRPHTPFVAPKKYFDLYPLESIPLPALSADDRSRTPVAAYASSRPEIDAATDEQRRLAIQGYHAATSFMDAQLGRVVDALDRLGLASNTVIVFLGDHGYHLGQHGLWQKRTLFEIGTRVPLVIVAPGARANGQVARGFSELLDVYPTLAELAGLPAPAYLDGRSLVPLLTDASRSVREHAITQVRRPPKLDGYAVRTERWRYIEWAEQPADRQLFDEDNDPGETTNLAADPQWQPVVAQLSAILAQERARK